MVFLVNNPDRRKHFLVTAGNTIEPIDEVRHWTNRFSGLTGLRIARALATAGDVTLLTSNRNHIEDLKREGHDAITVEPFTDHADLRAQLAERMTQETFDAVFMTAAVSDYKPAGSFAVQTRETLEDGTERWIVQNVQAPKVRSTHKSIAFLGTPTEKLIDLFRKQWNYRGLLVKFKLEVGLSREDLISVGESSRTASGADYLVANTLDMVTGAAAGAYLLSDRAPEWVARDALPMRLVKIVQSKH